MSGPLKVPGVEMTFDGTAYVVPALNAAAVKQYRKETALLLSGAAPDMDGICKLLHAALLRNYPDMKIEQVEQWVDYTNMLQIMDVIMHMSGLVQQMGELRRRMELAEIPPALKN